MKKLIYVLSLSFIMISCHDIKKDYPYRIEGNVRSIKKTGDTFNGYQIDTQLTNMMNQSQVKLTPGKQIVCLATYFGDKQPNIVYMK